MAGLDTLAQYAMISSAFGVTEIRLVEVINFKWYVDGVSNRGITGLVPRGVIGLLRIVGIIVVFINLWCLCVSRCLGSGRSAPLTRFGVCVFGEPFSRIGFGRSAPSLGARYVLGKETP